MYIPVVTPVLRGVGHLVGYIVNLPVRVAHGLGIGSRRHGVTVY